MSSVVAFGETFADAYWHSGKLLVQLGGCCANVASEISLMGGKASIITKVSDDILGKFLLKSLADYGVITNLIVVCHDKKHHNTLNLIFQTNDGIEHLTYNGQCAEFTLRKDEVLFDEIPKYDIFHFGSNPLVSPNDRLVDECIAFSKQHGLKISYDVNLRPGFWANNIEASQVINKYVRKSDYVKMNEYEAEICTGSAGNLFRTIELLSNRYSDKVIIVTCSEKGSYILSKGVANFIPPREMNFCDDDVGAGDAYYAVFLHYLHSAGMDDSEYISIAKIATEISALTVKYPGTIPAFRRALSDIDLNP